LRLRRKLRGRDREVVQGPCVQYPARRQPNPYHLFRKLSLGEPRRPGIRLEEQIDKLDQEMATLMSAHQDVVQRLAGVPGLGVDSAQQIIAEVGPAAAAFPSTKHLVSWVGVCPGKEESPGVNYSHRSPIPSCSSSCSQNGDDFRHEECPVRRNRFAGSSSSSPEEVNCVTICET
jgi:Transposase IS116/IS110/IS902 family